MQTRTIKTMLHGKEEIFEAIALAESCGFPLLLVGEPGVAKTQAMVDYACAIEGDMDSTFQNSFVIELDEGTKPSQITGVVDLKKLTQEQEYDVITPITESKYIMINEVDKGTSGIRNSLLSVMREKALMIGREYRKCKWVLLIGTCNVINDDEEERPFWDRWLLKVEVPRVPIMKLMEAWETGGKEVTVNISSPEEIEAFQPPDKEEFKRIVSSFLELYHSSLTDRSAYQIPFIIKACMLVYAEDATESAVRTAKFMNHKNLDLIRQLANKIEDPEIQKIKTVLERMLTMDDPQKLKDSLTAAREFIDNPKYSDSKKNSIKRMLQDVSVKNPKIAHAVKTAKKKQEAQ